MGVSIVGNIKDDNGNGWCGVCKANFKIDPIVLVGGCYSAPADGEMITNGRPMGRPYGRIR